jgi:hypothetical protein
VRKKKEGNRKDRKGGAEVAEEEGVRCEV